MNKQFYIGVSFKVDLSLRLHLFTILHAPSKVDVDRLDTLYVGAGSRTGTFRRCLGAETGTVHAAVTSHSHTWKPLTKALPYRSHRTLLPGVI